MSTAPKYDLLIEQGSTFERTFVWSTVNTANSRLPPTPVNLTGYTARMQIRSTILSPTVLFEATTENGKIVITAATGQVKLIVPAIDSAAWTFIDGVYDLEVIQTSSGFVKRLVQGDVKVSKEVTR